FREAGARVPWMWAVGLVLLLPSYIFAGTALMATVGLTFTFLGYGLILMWAVNRPPSSRWLVTGIAGIGYFSYSIYLWHRPISLFFDSLPQNTEMFGAYLMGCISVGVVMSKLIEIPSLRIRDRCFPGAIDRTRTWSWSPPPVRASVLTPVTAAGSI